MAAWDKSDTNSRRNHAYFSANCCASVTAVSGAGSAAGVLCFQRRRRSRSRHCSRLPLCRWWRQYGRPSCGWWHALQTCVISLQVSNFITAAGVMDKPHSVSVTTLAARLVFAYETDSYHASLHWKCTTYNQVFLYSLQNIFFMRIRSLLYCIFVSRIFMPCNFMFCGLVIWSVNFMSCKFMSCSLFRQIHALHFQRTRFNAVLLNDSFVLKHSPGLCSF